MKFKTNFKTKQMPEATAFREQPWHILIVDDEIAIHQISRLVLARKQVLGRPLQLHSAMSAAEARELLGGDTEFAMAFIDVVMEQDDAGLTLVDWIRNELKNSTIRLILRTGQAGLAPEDQVITRYDINDYKTKTELTAQKLVTAVYTAIRGYRDIVTIQRSLEAFRRLIECSTDILKIRDLSKFASAALANLLSLMDMDSSALYIVRREKNFYQEEQEVALASCGRFDQGEQVDNLPGAVRNRIDNAFRNGKSSNENGIFVGVFATSQDTSSVLYIEYNEHSESFNSSLAELFANNLALVLESLVTHAQQEQTQHELMYIVGDAIEARSKETGSHVKRVSLLCELIAEKLGLPPSFVHAIKIAAPLHDIGKVTTPEAILHKPGPLDPEEWAIMQSHATVGGSLLSRSSLPIARMGATLARYHHECWDGSGYPEGLKGKDIPMEARIMALVDVFDALGSKRSYKTPWPAAKIRAYLLEQSGKKFDPSLVQVLLDNFDLCQEVRSRYPDY
ncbi:HD domain-containing phosphohydrolase [Shewanella sedimentimangrovi]|nr:HD domain-containing phosphohydrolase [Shewanella sedimentimangrovi]